MGFNEDDFKEFLYGNFPDDFRSYTKAEISDSAKTSIINRHERSYGIWRSLASEPWIRAFYGNRLPSELLSGQLNIIDFRERVIRMVCQPTIYMNNEVVALRMQYPTTMPNMVYSVIPHQEMSRYANILEQAGYDEDNLQNALACKEKSLLFMGKMQAAGISEKSAASIMQEAENINIAEQFAALNEKMAQAQTPEDLEHQHQQLNAFMEVNAKHLYQHRHEFKALNKQIKKQQKNSKLNKKISEIKDKSAKVQPLEAKSVLSQTAKSDIQPPFLEDLNRHNADDMYGIKGAEKKFGIYDYMNNRMDATVDAQLKQLDKEISTQKATTKQANPQEPLISGKLSEHLRLPEDMSEWSKSYVQMRAQEDEQWLQSMSKGIETIDQAAAKSTNYESFIQSLHAQTEAKYAQLRANMEQRYQSLQQQSPQTQINLGFKRERLSSGR